MSLIDLTFQAPVDVCSRFVADEYRKRYGQAKGTTQRVVSEDSKAVATFTFSR